MQPIYRFLPAKKAIVDVKEIASIVDSCLQNSYELGFKVGYHRGHQDQELGKPYNDHPET